MTRVEMDYNEQYSLRDEREIQFLSEVLLPHRVQLGNAYYGDSDVILQDIEDLLYGEQVRNIQNHKQLFYEKYISYDDDNKHTIRVAGYELTIEDKKVLLLADVKLKYAVIIDINGNELSRDNKRMIKKGIRKLLSNQRFEDIYPFERIFFLLRKYYSFE
jgi:hypothetical protein